MTPIIYTLLIIAVIAVAVIGIYNGLVRLRNKATGAWADLEAQLKRRYDLIPNLVETVKGYATHEKETLENVTQARTAAMGATTPATKETQENALTQALKSVFAVAENYPDLKANQNFLDLQQNLSQIEEHIALARRYYNSTVTDYNTKVQVFPNTLIAKPFNFTAKEFFQLKDEAQKEVPKVQF